MRTKRILTGAICLVFSFGMIGAAMAVPDGSQRLRGLGGRVFQVDVNNLTTGDMFPNCYGFNSDGSWDDPLFLPGNPVPGTWVQHSNGARTTYTAEAEAELVIPGFGTLLIELVQEGSVTPARGKGTLQLYAETTVYISLLTPDGPFLLGIEEIISIGEQNNDCSIS